MKNRLLISAVALALIQIGFLSWIIGSRAMILRNGQEVLLKVEPVDPRDLLRGDYVRLGYEASSVPAKLIVNRDVEASAAADGPIHVRLKKGEDGFWHPVAAALGAGFANAPGEDEVDVLGTTSSGWAQDEEAVLHVDYGIGRFYLPEGEGKAIERDMRVRSFGILAAVDRDGTLQIKALKDGDTTLFSEPLY
ncbi:GDYXXLXY domain-containing protein [Pseudaminobacter soli (ex Li et al. 2025)]|nr:GDYXXLXY domain-containing protein [Mesorhizobium soli]